VKRYASLYIFLYIGIGLGLSKLTNFQSSVKAVSLIVRIKEMGARPMFVADLAVKQIIYISQREYRIIGPTNMIIFSELINEDKNYARLTVPSMK
jgi:hypothetical protein